MTLRPALEAARAAKDVLNEALDGMKDGESIIEILDILQAAQERVLLAIVEAARHEGAYLSTEEGETTRDKLKIIAHNWRQEAAKRRAGEHMTADWETYAVAMDDNADEIEELIKEMA